MNILVPEHLHAPSSGGGEETRAQVSGGVQRVTTVQSHRDADAQQDQTHGQRLHASRSTNVPAIHNRQNTDNQHSRPHHLMDMMEISGHWTKPTSNNHKHNVMEISGHWTNPSLNNHKPTVMEISGHWTNPTPNNHKPNVMEISGHWTNPTPNNHKPNVMEISGHWTNPTPNNHKPNEMWIWQNLKTSWYTLYWDPKITFIQ